MTQCILVAVGGESVCMLTNVPMHILGWFEQLIHSWEAFI